MVAYDIPRQFERVSAVGANRASYIGVSIIEGLVRPERLDVVEILPRRRRENCVSGPTITVGKMISNP